MKFRVFDNIDIMKEVIIVGVNKYFGTYLNLIYNFRGAIKHHPTPFIKFKLQKNRGRSKMQEHLT